MDVNISWSPNQEYGSSVFNLDNASKIMANQFETAGKDYLANFPALSISDQSSKSTTKENARHSKERKTKGLPTIIHEDSNTVATTVSSSRTPQASSMTS
jgi:NAD dependent epimerase/dehydratase family enzyme